MSGETTHVIELLGRADPNGPMGLVARFIIADGEAMAYALGPGTRVFEPQVNVKPLDHPSPPRRDPFDFIDGLVDWDVLPVEVWQFIANALDTAATQYANAARTSPNQSQAASLGRTYERADKLAATIRRAIDDESEE